MGTALNKILKDLVVKSKTMAGFRAPYVPGWDCHGLPIEYKVVKEIARPLAARGAQKRREAFARKFIDIQREQFKRLGVFGDWEHPYLTLDPAYEAEILRAFAVFVEKGLVYESMKPVFWSTGAQTALAEAEVEYQDREDTAVYVKFPIATRRSRGQSEHRHLDDDTVDAAGESRDRGASEGALRGARIQRRTACPKRSCSRQRSSKRFAPRPVSSRPANRSAHFPAASWKAVGAQHPFLPRTSIILTADFVTMDTGTGCVHIAPGHGDDDYSLGRKNGLPILSPVDDHGRYTDEAGLAGAHGQICLRRECRHRRAPARKRDADQRGSLSAFVSVLLALEDADHLSRGRAVLHSHRRSARATRSTAIKDVALDSAWGENRISGTVESRPDWVISRQRSWGVPLPVFYSPEGEAILDADMDSQAGRSRRATRLERLVRAG